MRTNVRKDVSATDGNRSEKNHQSTFSVRNFNIIKIIRARKSIEK